MHKLLSDAKRQVFLMVKITLFHGMIKNDSIKPNRTIKMENNNFKPYPGDAFDEFSVNRISYTFQIIIQILSALMLHFASWSIVHRFHTFPGTGICG